MSMSPKRLDQCSTIVSALACVLAGLAASELSGVLAFVAGFFFGWLAYISGVVGGICSVADRKKTKDWAEE